MIQDLWIVGGGGAALEVWAVAKALPNAPWRLRGFLLTNGEIAFDPEGLEARDESAFLGDVSTRGALVVLAIGEPMLRAKVADRYTKHGVRFATLIHPTAVVGPNCTLGAGSVVMAHAVLETHVSVGDHTLLNVGCSIAHNGRLAACCSLGPGVRLAGWATIGDCCDLGVNSCLRPRVTLGPRTRVGAGAAVVKDCSGDVTLVGIPARPQAAPEG